LAPLPLLGCGVVAAPCRVGSAALKVFPVLGDVAEAPTDACADTIDRLRPGADQIAPAKKNTPPKGEALAERLYAMLPCVRITDLLTDVAKWTLFPDCFAHLRTGEAAADSRILMAGCSPMDSILA